MHSLGSAHLNLAINEILWKFKPTDHYQSIKPINFIESTSILGKIVLHFRVS